MQQFKPRKDQRRIQCRNFVGLKIIDVPKEIDIQIAFDALKAMDVKIDKLTPEQVKYANNW